jgi:type VI secretion system secreted protein VgrG
MDRYERNLDGAGYLHLEDVPDGPLHVEFGPDIRGYQRKDSTDNHQFVGTSLNESDINALIAKHSGGEV